MSLILDALKKLDREMAAGRKNSGTVGNQILRQDRAKPKYQWIIFLTIVAACVGAVTTIVLMVGIPGFMKPADQTPQTFSKKLPTVSPAGRAVAQPSEAPVPISGRQETTQPEPNRALAEPAEKKVTLKTPPRAEKIDKPVVSDTHDVPNQLPEAAMPVLKVSGIVWQEDPQARRAVVNDVVAREGFVMDGVKIVEIRPTVVRFKKGTKSFEISVGK